LVEKSFDLKGFINYKIPANNVDEEVRIKNIEKAIKVITVSLIVTIMVGAYIMGFTFIQTTPLSTLINEQPITFTNNSCSTNDFIKLYKEAMKLETGKYLGRTIFYIMSNGTKQPNSEISFYVRDFPNNYLQLVETIKGIKMEIYFHDPNMKVCEKVFEEFRDLNIIDKLPLISYTIGNETNVYYLIIVKVIDKEEKIVDATASLIYVPIIQKINAKLVSDKKVYGKWEVMRYCLVNEGPTRIYFGLDYYVYYYNETEWTGAKWLGPGIVPTILLGAEPGQVKCFELNLNGTKPGKYMLVKEISAEGVKDGNKKLTLEFEVIENFDLVNIVSLLIQTEFIIKVFKVSFKTGYFKNRLLLNN
jgi:hypothetical protein